MGSELAWLQQLRDNITVPWQQLLTPFSNVDYSLVSLHLGVFSEPYLTWVLDGRKTIESRFFVRPMPPYCCVNSGDVVLVKQSGGPVIGAFVVGYAWNYKLDPASIAELRDRFSRGLCAQDSFWEDRDDAEYATLIRVVQPMRLPPVRISKRDRRGWVVLVKRNATGVSQWSS